MRKLIFGVSAVLLTGMGLLAQGPSAAPRADVYGNLRWRYIGPEGNRISAVAGVPGDPLVYYAGSASGGIAKTIDGGVHWQHIFDDQPVQSIGALAVAPSDPNIVWAGTGEAWIRSHISIGEGIYKSMDAGKTWSRMGLEKTGRIGRVVIDPVNPEIVLACALGTAYGPQQERGVFRTTDGGATWQRTLFTDENTGCSEIAANPANPRILYAGMWQLEIHTWGRESGGPGSGLFMSRDGGVTWKKLTGRGLPTKPVGKVMPATARSNPNRIYVNIETGDGLPWHGQETERGQLWRSDDGGENWKMVNTDRNAMGRTAYYARLAVSTDNDNETYFLNASYSRSIDAGATIVGQSGDEAPGGDHHDMWIDPTNGNRMVVGHDQGVSISQTRGRTWLKQRLANAQLYHVTVDNQVPYYVYTNKQDGPSYRGPSNSRLSEGGGRGGGGRGGGIPRGMWHSIGGGESGFATPDPVDPNIIWSTASGAGSVGGIVVRYDEARRQMRDVEVWPENANGPAADLKYRFLWDAPFHISPHDRNKIYITSQYVHQSTDGGQSWQEISPDLTLNDKTRQGSSGGLTPDNIGVEYGSVIHAIAESPKQAGVIWVGTNDGLVQVTRDGGKSWTNVTKNIPNLPPWGTVGNVEPSRHDAGTAYIAVDFHQVNNRDPFVYKTTDFGASWTVITNGIPPTMLSYAHCIREDPVRRGLLYLGTENGVYVSFNDGDQWQPLQMNLPHAPVYWLAVQEQFNDLVIATYGRGAWILDDLTPLRALTPAVLNADAQLFAPRPAYRFRAITAPATPYDDQTVGENPPYGAGINYYVKSAPANGSATITIQDGKGQTVRTLNGPATPGLHRVYWDLRDTASKRVAFRTSPLYAPDIRVGPDGLRESEGGFGAGGGGIAILQAPGTYTVKLSVGGRDYTQPLRVLKDPHSAGTEADIAAQQQLLSAIRLDLDNVVDAVNSAELIRGQIANLKNMIQDTELKKAAGELDQKVAAVEGNLVELRATGRGQDGVRFGSKLVQKFGYLANGLQSGDFKPTNQQVAVHRDLNDKLKGLQGQFK